MNLLFAQNAQGIGGSENYLVQLLPALRNLGHDVAFAGIHNTRAKGSRDEVEQWMQKFRDRNVPVFFRECTHYADPGNARWLYSVYQRGPTESKPFDLLHSHLIYADFWSAMIRMTVGKRFRNVSTVHGYEEKTLERFVLHPSQVPHNLYWQIFHGTRRCIALTYSCSAGLRDFCREAGIRGAADWPVIEHGFDFPEHQQTSEPAPRFGWPQVTVVGRLIRRKGLPLALEAICQLQREYPDVALVIVGSGPEEADLRHQSTELGLDRAVHFIGFDPEPSRWMNAADVILIPSYAEGLPLVIFEAFQAGKPVVAFHTIGCRDMVRTGETGLLARPFDPADLAQQIRRLLSHPEQALRMTQQAHARLIEHYSLGRMASETSAIYEKVI